MSEIFSECLENKCELRKFIDQLNHVVVLQNADGEYIYLNNFASHILKIVFNQKDILGKKPDQIFSKDEAEIIFGQIKKVTDTKKPLNVKNLYKIKNKKYFFHETLIPIQIEKGKVKTIAKIGKDITKEKIMRETIEESEIKFYKLIENIPCGLVIIQDKELKLMNTGFSKITGYSDNKFNTLDDILNIIRPEFKEIIVKNYNRRIFGDGSPSIYDAEIDSKEEGKKIIKIYATRITYHKRPASMATFFDITNEKKLELKLTKQKNQLAEEVEKKTDSLKKSNKKLNKTSSFLMDLINSSNDVIIAFDEFKNLIIWNKTIEEITNIPGEEIKGKNLSKLEFIESQEKIQEYLTRKERNQKADCIIRTKSGDYRIIQCSFNSIEQKDGKYGGVLIVGKDITETKKIVSDLIPGHSYLITPEYYNVSKQIIDTLVQSGFSFLTVTRGFKKIEIKSSKTKFVQYEWSEDKNDEKATQSINDFYQKFLKFINKNKKSLIFVNRIDYLLINEQFNEVMRLFFKMNSTIRKSNSYLFIEINPQLFTEKELDYLKMEFDTLPLGQNFSCNLLPIEMEILRYIHNKNLKNILVSYKDISKKFSMVSQTTSNKLKQLELKGVINIIKNGKRKNLFISNKGKMILIQ